jgi:hypothetical protein
MEIYTYDAIPVYISDDGPRSAGAFQGLGFAGRILAEEALRRPRVLVNASDHEGRRIKATLATLGGIPCQDRAGCMFEFTTTEDRDDALDAVRSRFGWTCVDAF